MEKADIDFPQNSISASAAQMPLYHSSFTNLLTKLPIYGNISTVNSSPAFNVPFGSLFNPTPAGVPVTITVPAGSVVDWDRNEINLGIPKINSSMPQSCITSLFLRPRMWRAAGSGIKEGETRTGPVIQISIDDSYFFHP